MNRTRLALPPSTRAALALLGAFGVGAAAARAEEAIGLRADGALVTFDTADPTVFTSQRAITGLPGGEILVGTDIRPRDGALFAVGLSSRVYQITPTNGIAVAVGPGPFSPILQGTDFGVSFDRTGDGLRITSDTGQNLVVDVGTGAVTSNDPAPTYIVGDASAGLTAGVTALAWTHSSQNGAVLYGIDLARGVLVQFDSPGTGAIHTVGLLGLGALQTGGYTALDVSPDTGTLYAVLAPSGAVTGRLYVVSAAAGGAVQIGGSLPALLRGAAIVPSAPPAPPETRLVGLTGVADIVTFAVGQPQAIRRTTHLRGLASGDSFLAVTTRPTTGVLYAITRTGLYDVDLTGGTAELVGPGFDVALPTSGASCDFDPRIDLIRVVTDAGANLTIHPDAGLILSEDTTFAFAAGDANEGAAPAVGALAFSGRATPATVSTAYVLEVNQALVATLGTKASAPNEARDGQLSTVGALLIDSVPSLPVFRPFTTTSDRTGYMALQTGASSSALHLVNLSRGTATFVGAIGSQTLLRGLTPEPTANPPRIDVTKLALKLSFKKTGRDSFSLKGAVPFVTSSFAGKSLGVDVAGLAKTFTLDASGRAKLGDDKVEIGGSAARGVRFKLTLKNEDFVSVLGDEDMTGATFQRKSPRRIVMLLTFDNRTYRVTVDVAYSAKPGKSGSAATN